MEPDSMLSLEWDSKYSILRFKKLDSTSSKFKIVYELKVEKEIALQVLADIRRFMLNHSKSISRYYRGWNYNYNIVIIEANIVTLKLDVIEHSNGKSRSIGECTFTKYKGNIPLLQGLALFKFCIV